MALESEAEEANLNAVPVPDNISTLAGDNPSHRKLNGAAFLVEDRREPSASRLVASLQPKPLLSKLQVMVANLVSNLYFEAVCCLLFACFAVFVSVQLSLGFPRIQQTDAAVYEGLFATNIALLSVFAVEAALKGLAFHSMCCSTWVGVDIAVVAVCLALEVAAAVCFDTAGGVGDKGALFVTSNLSKQFLVLYKLRHYEFYYIIMAVFKNSRDRELIKLIQEKLQNVRAALDPQSDDVASLNWIIYRIGCVLRMKRSHCSKAKDDNEEVDFAGLDEETRRYLLETYSRKTTEVRRHPSTIEEEEQPVLETEEPLLTRAEMKKRELPGESFISPRYPAINIGSLARATAQTETNEQEGENETETGTGTGTETEPEAEQSEDTIFLVSQKLGINGVFDDTPPKMIEEGLQTQTASQANEDGAPQEGNPARSAFIPREPYSIPEDNEAKMPHVKIKVVDKAEKEPKAPSYAVSDQVPRRYSLKNPKRKRSSLTSVASSPIFGIRRLFAPIATPSTSHQASSLGGSDMLDVENPAETQTSQRNRHVTGDRCGLRDADVNAISSHLVKLFQKAPISLSESVLERVNCDLDEWNFDIFWLDQVTDGHPLSYATSAILQKNALYSVLSLSELKVHNFLIQVEDGYQSTNPYHNAIHAADVVQTIHVFFTYNQLRDQLTHEDVLCSLLAAAIHDYRHPGVNNSFLSAVNSSLALQYNDRSVLENMHVAAAFRLMTEQSDCDVLSCFPTREGYYSARESIIQMVLATDMSHHFEGVEQFKSKVLGASSTLATEGGFGLDQAGAVQRKSPVLNERMRADGENTYESVEERLLPLETRRILLNTTLHCADLSNPAKPLDLARKWALLVQEEMFLQGDKERDLDLPISMFMDRKKNTLFKCQIGFLTIIIKPLFSTFFQFVPSMSESIDECINQNLAYWQRSQDELEAKLGRTRTMSSIDRSVSSDRIDARTGTYNRQKPVNAFTTFLNQSIPIRRSSSSTSVATLTRFTGSTNRRGSAKGSS